MLEHHPLAILQRDLTFLIPLAVLLANGAGRSVAKIHGCLSDANVDPGLVFLTLRNVSSQQRPTGHGFSAGFGGTWGGEPA